MGHHGRYRVPRARLQVLQENDRRPRKHTKVLWRIVVVGSHEVGKEDQDVWTVIFLTFNCKVNRIHSKNQKMDDIDYLESMLRRQNNYRITPLVRFPLCVQRIELLKWMYTICNVNKTPPIVFFMAANLMDRGVCTIQPSTQDEAMLIAGTAIYISSKLEETYPMVPEDITYYSENRFSRMEIVSMERELISALKFYINPPTTYHFLLAFWNADTSVSVWGQTRAHDILVKSMRDLELLREYSSSEIAAGVLYIMRYKDIPGRNWAYKMERITHVTDANVVVIASKLPM